MRCLATQIQDGWFLSARHCLEHWAEIAIDNRPADFAVVHPVLDAALVEIQSLAATVATSSGDVEKTGLIVGADWTASASVTPYGKQLLLVNSQGTRLPCEGDSGAPLFGQTGVMGILTRGSQACRGLDLFVRLDALLPWVRSQMVSRH